MNVDSMRVYERLVTGPTQYWWAYFGLCMGGGALASILAGFGFLALHLTAIFATLAILALVLMWGVVTGFTMSKRMQRREKQAGYFASPADSSDIGNEIVQVDPLTGVVVREAGSPPISGDEWDAARRAAWAWARHQIDAGEFPALPRGWPNPRKAAARAN